MRVIQSADSKTKENVNATENCISAVGKMMKFKPDCVNVEEVLPHWLSWLPLHEDKEEAVQTFSYLCDLIERCSLAFSPFLHHSPVASMHVRMHVCLGGGGLTLAFSMLVGRAG